LDKSFYGEDLMSSSRIWVENYAEEPTQPDFTTMPRVGINYAGEYWAGKHWRFRME
ncbi:MAG: DNA-3-methyladenine glycosylase, partial [Marinilabiliaceae bacterium]